MLFVIMMSGALTITALENQAYRFDNVDCARTAAELRKSDKVADAFCIGIDPDDETKSKIYRKVEDGQDHN